ncbi:unnamed protein product [Closterium sp. Naga37s-1]|nr:unnamed protein product [Closterium sp. Naga37s-1]
MERTGRAEGSEGVGSEQQLVCMLKSSLTDSLSHSHAAMGRTGRAEGSEGVSNNSFTGGVKAVGSLPRVADLRLQNNRLSGTVPAAFKDKTCDPFSGNSNLFCPPDFASAAPTIPATVPEAPPSSSSSIWPIVGGIAAGVVCLVLFLAAAWWWWRQRRQKERVMGDEEGLEKDDINDPLHEEILGHLQQLQRFRLEDLRTATSGFSSTLLLGEGGYGLVYRGSLRDGKQVAIKLLKKERRGSEEAFINEVNAISGAVHRNLLRLEGFCVEKGERALVFPFLPHGSVADYLKGGKMRSDATPLTWKHRRKIVLGIAEGLAYMHTDCTPRLIHCDMKAENVLLTEDNDPVICDFGLSKLVEVDVIPSAARGNRPSAAVRGTLGHLAPELYNTGKWSEKTDVFGFGVLLVELVAGCCVFDLPMGQHVQIRSHPADCDPLEVQVFLQVALLCLQQSPSDRPTMSECVTMLQGTGLACRWQLWHNTGLEDGLQPPDMPVWADEQELDKALGSGEDVAPTSLQKAPTPPPQQAQPPPGQAPGETEAQAVQQEQRSSDKKFPRANADQQEENSTTVEGQQSRNEGERTQEERGGGGEHWERGDWEVIPGGSSQRKTEGKAERSAEVKEDGGARPSYRQGSRFDRVAARSAMRRRREGECWSKEERHLYHTANPDPPSAAFQAAVRAHEAMQRECMGTGKREEWEWVRSGDWEKDRPRYGPDRKPCQYIYVPPFPRGLGNRLVNHVNAFILALITHRAIITTPWSFVVRRFCNPFGNSTSWSLPFPVHSSFIGVVKNRTLEFKDLVKYHSERGAAGGVVAATGGVEATGGVAGAAGGGVAATGGAAAGGGGAVGGGAGGGAAGGAAAGGGRAAGAAGLLELSAEEVAGLIRTRTVNIHLAGRGAHTFCTDAWSSINAAVFWSMAIDVYFVPSLYYLPTYAAALNKLFPDHRVLTHTARFLLHPDNRLWAAITRLFHANLAHHSHRVGIQIRSALGIDLPLADRVLSCAADVARYLPTIGSSNQTQPANSTYPEGAVGEGGTSGKEGMVGEGEGEGGTVGVVVASLSAQHWMDMQGRYALHGAHDSTLLSFCT